MTSSTSYINKINAHTTEIKTLLYKIDIIT